MDIEQKRLEDLRDRSEWGKLTHIEHEDQLEDWRVERLEALIESASLTNIDLLTLNRQLVSESPLFHAV